MWRFVRAEGMQPQMHPSGDEPAGPTVYLPGWQVDDVPADAYVLTAEQTAAQAIVRGARQDGADLVLDVAAWFTNLELDAPTLTVKTDGDIAEVAPHRRAARRDLASRRPASVPRAPAGP